MSEEEYEKATEVLEKEFDLEERNYNHQMKGLKNKRKKKNLIIIICTIIFIGIITTLYLKEVNGFKRKLDEMRKQGEQNYLKWLDSLNDGKGTDSLPSEEEPKEEISIGKQNAVKQAQSYLSHSAFSKKGLREQLEYEGYTKEEIDYAIEIVYK